MTLEHKGPFDPIYLIDHTKAFKILATFLTGTAVWVYVKIICKLSDGRKLFQTVDDHYLGPSKLDHMADQCDSLLQALVYKGGG